MIEAFDLNSVYMRDEYCVNALIKDTEYLKSLDTDMLLAGFYENAGLKMKKMRYPGWENMLIGGHSLGHYLTAAAQAYANPGVDDKDKDILYDKLKALIDGLLECQKASKGKPGFVFGAVILNPDNVEQQFDNVEEHKCHIITEAWVPWYTMHKILDGVVKVYEITGYAPALELGSGIGDWTYARCSTWSEETHKTVLSIEYGGMNDCLYELYKNTKKKEHLEAAHYFDEEELYKKVASGAENVLTDHHANTTIPKFLGALNRYMTLGEEAAGYLEYVKAFWDMVVIRHTYVTGGNSEWEHFGADNVLDAERTNCNNETCNTYNMLKMSRDLFRITGDKKYADYYENTFINAILSSQNPENGMTMYFQPMATGYYKVYGTPYDKFWCCTGTGMENFTKLNDSIYFKDDDGIYVNMFFASELEDKQLGLKLVQKTDITDVLRSEICIEITDGAAEKETAVKVRIPDWAEGFSGKVESSGNVTAEEINGYMVYKSKWHDGDKIELSFEMKVKAFGLADCDNVFAFKYGPLLLSADLGTENMVDGTTGVAVTIPTNKIVKSEYLNISEGSTAAFIDDIDKHFERLGELRFRLGGTDQELIFSPHYKKTRERYGIYWYFLDKEAGEGEREEARRRRELEEIRRESVLDVVQPGYGQYESDELHAMEDKGSEGFTDKGTARIALPGGGFTYHMKAIEGEDLILELTFLREDNGKPIEVFVGDEKVYGTRLHYTGGSEEYTVEIKINSALISNSIQKRVAAGEEVRTVPIGFKSGAFVPSARVYGFIYLLRNYRK